MPSRTAFPNKRPSILKSPRVRSRKLDLTGRRTIAYERRQLSLLSKARISAAKRKPSAFIKRRKTLTENYLKRRV